MIYDSIRKLWVAATPEEKVRQDVIQTMIALGYPKSLIGVEKQIASTDRRADIICFAKNIHPSYPLYPLLVVECKAQAVADALQQALGYNQSVQAYFIALASPGKIQTFWHNGKKYDSCDFLPKYEELLSCLRS